MAEKACQVVASTTQVGLIQALAPISSIANLMKRATIILGTALLTSGCTATSPRQTDSTSQGSTRAIDYHFAVETPNDTPVDAAAYNKMIVAQGSPYYCGSRICDKLPQLLSGDAPVYPPGLLVVNIEGDATVVFTIDEQGFVTEAGVESATRAEFADSALTAIRSCRFKPASLNCKPARSRSRQQFPFNLR